MNRSKLNIELYRFLECIAGKELVRAKYLGLSVKKYLRANCIFIHIPKAAGTTVAESVLGGRAGHFTALEVKDYLGLEEFNSLYSFSISREPLSRLVSAYQYVKNGGGEHGGVRKEIYFQGPEFRSFDSFVQEWLVFEELRNTNLLFKPQHLFVCDKQGDILVKELGKYEDLKSFQDVLSLQLTRDIRFKELNRTKSSIFKFDNIAASTKTLVLDLYSRDYELFKY